MDSLMYVINFADEQGFAIVPVPEIDEEVLAITEQGNYSEETDNVPPGFLGWLEDAKKYVAQESQNPQQEDLNSLEASSNELIKEYNDTISVYKVGKQLKGCWGQGAKLSERQKGVNELWVYPEGYYFSNALCGCGPLAIAQICAFFKQPQALQGNIGGALETVYFDWNEINLHRKSTKFSDEETGDQGTCFESNWYTTHIQIAKLCRILANLAQVQETSTGTGATLDGIQFALTLVMTNLSGRNVSPYWGDYTGFELLQPGELFLMTGTGISVGHAWVADGAWKVDYYKCRAKRQDTYSPWVETRRTKHTSYKVRFQWGWYGKCDGWYSSNAWTTDNDTFYNPKFLRVW